MELYVGLDLHSRNTYIGRSPHREGQLWVCRQKIGSNLNWLLTKLSHNRHFQVILGAFRSGSRMYFGLG